MFDREQGKHVPGYLRNLKLRELSGCGRGANQYARVVLVKADGVDIAKKYASVDELPSAIKSALPKDAQAVFMRVANAQLGKDAQDEEGALKIAWTAVKNGWKKEGDAWVKKAAPALDEALIDRIAKAFYGYASPSGGGDGENKGARSFNELIAQREEAQRECEINEEIWPLFSSLEDSIRSVIADESVDDNSKLMLIRQSVEQFMIAMALAVPEALAEAELNKLLKAIPALAGAIESGEPGSPRPDHGGIMPSDLEKKVADLESQIATSKTALETASKSLQDANTKVTELTTKLSETETAKAAVAKELDDLKKAAETAKTDEVITIPDPADVTKSIELRKSEVGSASFAFAKAQQSRLDKAESDRTEVVFAKRAETEIGALPGDATMKGKVLKAVEEIADEKVRGAAIAALKAGNAALKSGFRPAGYDGGDAPSGDSAEAKLDAMAKAHAEKNGVSFAKAYTVVIDTPEGRELYKQSIGSKAAA
jgi:cation transport regulator ChaB